MISCIETGEKKRARRTEEEGGPKVSLGENNSRGFRERLDYERNGQPRLLEF